MTETKKIGDWMREAGMTLEDLVARSGLDAKVVEAIVEVRYTPNPKQRDRVAAALGVECAAIQWGHASQVEQMYGHGPQFGRSP